MIEASENLAKKPVEDFTKEEEELLKGLAAAEEDLAKFMGEVHSDLSKLPEQDFADPSMAKELVEIQTELKMAEDALTKKSVDIAVPLEQLGYERAEELKTNLEKWLPDTPDREKWSQEESLTDKDKEAPMAELPSELEDIVGELMEQEEDLIDETEDVSSSAADSLDKGAGWDAMDGPISNMSAKGVTGNRLPNTSEIGGRSGEGRQGKSSGEFVGDEAVGKGGRKTPSRLTPDPVVKGQIKDHNKQRPAGPPAAARRAAAAARAFKGPSPNSPGPRDAGTAGRPPGDLAEQGRGRRPPLPGVQLPSHRSQEDDRRDGARSSRTCVRAATATPCASATCSWKGSATSSSISKAKRKSARTPPRTCRPTSRRKSSAACTRPRPPAGKNSTGNTSSGSAAARRKRARGESGKAATKWKGEIAN